MLPLVGIVAIGFLVVAGKLFFFSASEEVRIPLPVIEPLFQQRDPGSQQGKPVQADDVSIDQEEQRPVAGSSSVEVSSVPISPPLTPSPFTPSTPNAQERGKDPLGGVLNMHAVPVPSLEANVKVNGAAKGEAQRENGRRNVVVVAPPPPRPAPIPAPPNPAPKPAPAPVPTPAPEPKKPSWMVQVGAFSTQAAAEAFLQRVTKAGYEGVVVSSKTLHRVLVQGEASREETLVLATRMSQNGFRGAFIVPPRQ